MDKSIIFKRGNRRVKKNEKERREEEVERIKKAV